MKSDYTRRNIRWFPDSRSLLLHDWSGFRRIDIVTGETRTLLETPQPVWMHAELSRDGRALYYSFYGCSP